MTKIVQEKFEVHSADKPEGKEGGGWVSDASARDRQGLQTRTATGRFEPFKDDLYNSLPPGSDIDDQEVYSNHAMPLAGGRGSGTQATEDVTRESLRKGYDRKKLRPTDDMYTREHNDAFYDTVVVDGDEGCVERNNYLDRL